MCALKNLIHILCSRRPWKQQLSIRILLVMAVHFLSHNHRVLPLEPQSKRVNKDYYDEKHNKGEKTLKPSHPGQLPENNKGKNQSVKPHSRSQVFNLQTRNLGNVSRDKILITMPVTWQVNSTKPERLHASLCFSQTPLFCCLERRIRNLFFSKKAFLASLQDVLGARK